MLAKLVMMPESEVKEGKPLSVYSVESLVAVEERECQAARETGVDISLF